MKGLVKPGSSIMSEKESIFKVNLDDEIRDVFHYQQISDEKKKHIRSSMGCSFGYELL